MLDKDHLESVTNDLVVIPSVTLEPKETLKQNDILAFKDLIEEIESKDINEMTIKQLFDYGRDLDYTFRKIKDYQASYLKQVKGYYEQVRSQINTLAQWKKGFKFKLQNRRKTLCATVEKKAEKEAYEHGSGDWVDGVWVPEYDQFSFDKIKKDVVPIGYINPDRILRNDNIKLLVRDKEEIDIKYLIVDEAAIKRDIRETFKKEKKVLDIKGVTVVLTNKETPFEF